ncbi:MAG: DUF523 domain-containing protein [Polyangiaceae bacterium]|nr:DUF523 domain-containing protein [Polyangiaceae bacterium]
MPTPAPCPRTATDTLADRYEQLVEERDSPRAELSDAEQDRDRHLGENTELTEERDELQEELKALQSELEDTRERFKSDQEERDAEAAEATRTELHRDIRDVLETGDSSLVEYHGRRLGIELLPLHGRVVARIRKLAESGRYELVAVCPEVDAGLPVPVPPTRLAADGRLVCGGKGVTEAFRHGGELAVEAARAASATKAYLIRGSPSCDRERGGGGEDPESGRRDRLLTDEGRSPASGVIWSGWLLFLANPGVSSSSRCSPRSSRAVASAG